MHAQYKNYNINCYLSTYNAIIFLLVCVKNNAIFYGPSLILRSVCLPCESFLGNPNIYTIEDIRGDRLLN